MAMQSQVNYVTDQTPELDDELILRNTDLLTLTDSHKVSRSTLVKHHSCCKEKKVNRCNETGENLSNVGEPMLEKMALSDVE